MRGHVPTPGALFDLSLALTITRYRKIRRALAPFLVVSLAGMLVLAFVAKPDQVMMATFIIPLVVAVRSRLARYARDGKFLADIFLWGFLLRALLGLVIYHFELWDFYGGDSTTYDWNGWDLAQEWLGIAPGSIHLHEKVLSTSNPGIIYFTAAFYYVFGHYLLLLQFVLSVIGAVTPILIVRIADRLFGDREVSIISGLLAAFFPSIVMWTCQLMKEGLLLFCFSLIVYSMQRSVLRFRLRYAFYIVAAMLAVLYLRFYIFYVLVVALAVALITPSRPVSFGGLVRQLALPSIVLASVFYLGGGWDILATFQEHTRLERIQEARLDQAVSARSGFERLADVSTPEGALRHLPIGFLYVMFGPFPWEVSNMRQVMALPEGLFWWVMIPALLRGLWLALRHRLPESRLILIFNVGVMLPYSFSQGNVGTAYRQRVQVQMFFFIFVALGYVWKKRKRLARALARQGRPTPAPVTAGRA